VIEDKSLADALQCDMDKGLAIASKHLAAKSHFWRPAQDQHFQFLVPDIERLVLTPWTVDVATEFERHYYAWFFRTSKTKRKRNVKKMSTMMQ